MVPNPTAREELGAKVKRLRQERGLGQERLAIEAHVDQSGLSKFERGKERKMGEAPLKRIAAVLGIGFDELVSGTTWTSVVQPSAQANGRAE
jgi:transcriptional regulator with XRE-family HTH domain